MSRSIPGSNKVEGREFLYIEILNGESFSSIVEEALASCPEVPLPKKGGIVEEKVRLDLEDNTFLLGLSYKGDLTRWKEKFRAFCDLEKRKGGVASNGRLTLWDGRELELSNCVVRFDP